MLHLSLIEHYKLPINNYLTWKTNNTIVILDPRGIILIGDTEEDFYEGNGYYCVECNKSLVGKNQKKFCSLKCVARGRVRNN